MKRVLCIVLLFAILAGTLITPLESASDCWQDLTNHDDFFISGKIPIDKGLTPQKIILAYSIIQQYLPKRDQDGDLYLYFATDLKEAAAIESLWNSDTNGVYISRVRIDGCSFKPTDDSDFSGSGIIVLNDDYQAFPDLFGILVHEFAHAQGARHDGWSKNAIFWGWLATYASIYGSKRCGYFEGEEQTICSELAQIAEGR